MPADRDDPLSRRFDAVPSDTPQVRRVMAALRAEHARPCAEDYPDGYEPLPPVPDGEPL
jgi:hypothetical protein